MYLRELQNRSGSISIQIINNVFGRYKVVKTVGCATSVQEIEQLKIKAKQEMKKMKGKTSLFPSSNDDLVEQAFDLLYNSNLWFRICFFSF